MNPSSFLSNPLFLGATTIPSPHEMTAGPIAQLFIRQMRTTRHGAALFRPCCLNSWLASLPHFRCRIRIDVYGRNTKIACKTASHRGFAHPA